ncbi:MAG: MBL fold metallo-hydrolase [Acidobacteria bacterium]|nr:MBL fold metallo-hydrolase [Acidobacteriota bacterium]
MENSESKKTFRLADSTVAEPLINSWAVWSDLISPTTYSLHLRHYQLKLLKSYLANPESHIIACRNPKLAAGRFVNVPVARSGEIRNLLERTEARQIDNLKFAEAITEFHAYLSKEAKGQSLEPYYEKLPEELCGYVELVYDYYNNPIVRFIERLLYDSPYYKKDLQSLRIFPQTSDSSRNYFLNTPRLLEEEQIDWVMPFESPKIDDFFKLEFVARPLDQIQEILGISATHGTSLLSMISDEPVPAPEKWTGPGARIRYLGHACALVEWNGVSILTDPFISALPKEPGVERLTYKELPERIDFALITHSHHDHFVAETLLRLRHRIHCLVVPRSFGIFYADVSLKLMAQKLGFKQVVELDTLESIGLPDGEIIAVPFLGEHADLAHGKGGYLIRTGKEKTLFAADSNCLDKRIYEHVRKSVGPIQTVFLGMECVGAPLSWLYGALLPGKLQYAQDQSRRTKGCDSSAALDLLEAVGGRRVYIYAMGNEPWLQHSILLDPSPESRQIKESEKLILKAREKGFIDAQRPFGKFDLHLSC